MLLLLMGCRKSDCVRVVGVAFSCPKPEDIWIVELHFQQGERVVMADVVYPYEFTNGVFKLDYRFYDTAPDILVWKVYSSRERWVEYRTKF